MQPHYDREHDRQIQDFFFVLFHFVFKSTGPLERCDRLWGFYFKVIISGSGDTAIMHHNITTGKRIKDYKGHTGDVAALRSSH